MLDKKLEIIIDQILNGEKYFYRNISVDSVIFGYHEKTLKVLLQKPTDMDTWLLPGGYVFKNERVEDAAYRIVRYRTGLKKLLLHQFQVFSNPGRSEGQKSFMAYFSKFTGYDLPENHWMFENFISIGFFALTEYSLVVPSGDFYAEKCEWWEINKLPTMGFDHPTIINKALEALKSFTHLRPIGYELLPEKFTIPEFQSLYETILNKEFDNRNFTKKMVSIGLIEKTNEKRKIGNHRSPYLYTFNKDRYQELIDNTEIINI